MAVFEKKVFNKVTLDDTENLTVIIENPQNINGHTEYVIRVQRGPNPEKSWLVCKRYSDFVALHSLIQVSGVNITLPPKKLIGNMDRSFVAQRQLELQKYLHAILANPILASCLAVKKFLDPHNYSSPFQELALQHVSMALRSNANLELVKPVPEMGWRLRKHYFLVKSKSTSKSDMVLQWTEFGPDKYLEDRDFQNILKSLITLNHPYIEKLEYVHYADRGCFSVRQFYQSGTLKDLIYGAKPKLSFLKKYGNPKQSNPLSVNDVSFYGKQLIDALMFLHEKGIPFGHLHLGNVLVLDKSIKLLDIENMLLGVPSIYRPFFVQHKKINSIEAIDVYSLGHVLFEMTFGYPLHESFCDKLPSTCSPALDEILELILTSRSCKSGMPTLQELLQHPFFNISCNNQSSKISFRFTTNLKHSLNSVIESTEKRLECEQKAIRHYKKLAKIHELLTSKDGSDKTVERLSEQKNSSSKPVKVDDTNSNTKKFPPRSDSLTSNSTAASSETATSPLQAFNTKSAINTSLVPNGRSALLDSICAFDKSVLRHNSAAVNGSAGS